ncbi:Fur family transcriptional regulator [Rhizobium wenxiniae]|uniref:Fur family transcriptional regulator n=1 Tax=Rhizobium wenxiniae TaxID=1737357 RepID=UPI003C213A9E
MLTKNQALVYGVLEKSREPVSAYSILERLRDHGFRAPLQVYRALDKLLELGKIHRLESINAFVACSHIHEDHSHGATVFAICESCGKVSEFHDDVISGRLADWEKSQRFKPHKTTIEIRGDCSDCGAHGKPTEAHSHSH